MLVEPLRRDRALAAALAAATLAALVPIWWPRFLPLGDLPAQLAQVAVWRHLSDPSWGFDRFYQAARLPVPGSGLTLPLLALSYPLPLEIACKLLLSLYALAVPASLVALGARFGRSPWLALLGYPLVFSAALSTGALPFCAGLPCALFALAALDAFLEAPSNKRLAWLLGLLLATYLFHVAAWLIACGCALPLLVAQARRIRAAALAAGALTASAGFAWIDLRWAEAGRALVRAVEPALPIRHEPAAEAAASLHHRVLYPIPGSLDETCLLLLVASWLLLTATARREGEERYRFRLRDFVPEIGLTLCVACYLFAPASAAGPYSFWSASARFVAPAALFGALAPRGPIGGLRRLLLAPALAACLIHPIALASRFADFDGRAAGIAHLMAKVPRGSSTLTLLLDPNGDPAVDPEIAPWAPFHAWAQILGGGYDPYARASGFPVRARPGTEQPAPPFGRPRDFNQQAIGWRYDFVLTHNESRDGELFGALFGRVGLVGRDGAWRLYATRGVR